MSKKKLLIVVIVAALVVAWFAFGLGEWSSLAAIKARQAQFAALYAGHPVSVIAAYAALYVLVFALALPVGAVISLLGGALFGLVVGTVVVSFASTAGAVLAFLASRHLLRDSVQARFGTRLAEVDAGIARDGAFYLFTLRLIPAFPPAAINLLFGLTAMRTRTFAWVSQAGMFPGTVVYVLAGTQLAQLDSLRGILSPGLVGAFVLLGLLPLAARKTVDALRARRVVARWAHLKPRRFDRNLVVIGAGAAGLVTAYIAAAVKAKVTLVEAQRMGGDCLNTGCVPSKALIRTATLMHQIRHAAGYGIAQAEARLDFAQAMARVAGVVRAVEPHDSVARYTALGVDVVLGRARLTSPWHVQITHDDGTVRTLATRAVVIASGAAPTVPPLPGLDEVGYLTSDTLWGLTELPPRLVVLGGGPIGCELAQAFARLGSAVTQVEALPRLLPREDADVSALVQRALAADGVTVLAGHRALRCERDGAGDGEGKRLVVQGGDGAERAVAFDALLVAVGRSARLAGFGLEELGIPAERVVATNEYLETLYPNILAAGDVAGPLQFTHVAAHQAWTASVNALFGSLKKFRCDLSVIPRAVFVDPEVARVGLSEDEARAQGLAFEVTRIALDDLDRAIADSAAHGFVKVLTPPGSDRILGATIVGGHAAEMLAEFTLAMRHGLGLGKILGTVHAYPTWSEAAKYAAGEWKRTHAPQRLLAWVERYHAWRRG
ncbi:MAG TPA: FAD-dependent oxidoreductase [Burkholderiaceae bacterium]|nr:FAD-dependent oxidoreductase [Burkholderiaceae bacterium]